MEDNPIVENQFAAQIEDFVNSVTFRVIKENPTKQLSFEQFKGAVLYFADRAELEVYVSNCYNLGVMPEQSLGVCAAEFINLRWASLMTAIQNM